MFILGVVFVSSCSQNGQFSIKTGEKILNDKLIVIAFVNESSTSFTIDFRNTQNRNYFLSEIVYPGNYSSKKLPSGEYNVFIKKGAGYTYKNKMIVWDEGDFEINGISVDVKIDLDTLWLQCGGQKNGYKF